MRTYGQYCPIARGGDTFPQRWTPLIVGSLSLAAEVPARSWRVVIQFDR
jgi:hypothetical protein